MSKSRQRSFSGRHNPSSNKSHIVQQTLNRKNQLIDKYQQQTQSLLDQIDSRVGPKRTLGGSAVKQKQSPGQYRTMKRNRLGSSYRNETLETDREVMVSGSMKDYQKVILGLEYALESERKKAEGLLQKNNSLELQISNLRNVLVGPNEARQYEKTVVKEMQDKVNQLEDKLLDQKKNYEFIIESKNEAITSLESELRTIQKDFESKTAGDKFKAQEAKENALTKKLLQLMSQMQQLRTTMTQKNVFIQSLKYRHQQYHANSGDESDDEIKKIRKQEKTKFYLEQLQTANKMIIKKNIEILNLGNKLMKLQEVIDTVEMYLDKKEIRNVDLNVLETAVITKLRVLLREKATFERELLGQLNQHNKKITAFESELTSKDSLTTNKLSELIADNKKLTALISSLQNNIKNLQKLVSEEKRENEYLRNEIEINKKQFAEQIKRIKGDLGTISSVTKNEFDRMKIQNLKLSEQNRSLLFLVGEKQREIHRKGETLKTFQDYRQKINSLDVSINQTEKRKIERAPEQTPQIGSKLLLINTFSGWMFEWNKIKSWGNKKVLLNLLLDKDEIRSDGLGSMNMLIDILHECLLQSKNVEIQQRAIILLRYYLPHNILKHTSLYMDKMVPILIRGFRQKIEGEEEEKHRLLNESTLKIFVELAKIKYQWTHEMTNEMLSVNGLKYLFVTITDSPLDDLIQMCYEVLIMITKQNQMVSFMISFNLTEIILKNLTFKYQFIVFLLELLKNLLQSDDFMRAQKSFLEFRKLVYLLKDESDEEVILLALECLQMLINNSGVFIKSLNKMEAVSIFNQVLKGYNDSRLLKKLAQVYGLVVENFDEDCLQKFSKVQVQKLLKIVSEKNITDHRFITALKIVLKVVEEINERNDLDEKVIGECFGVYQIYETLEEKSRGRLNKLVQVVYQRNKPVINKFSSDSFITNLVQAYKSTSIGEQILVLLKILLFENQQKHTTQILRSGRQNYIDKLISDCMGTKNYQLAILGLKNLLAIAREKYVEKFINVKIVAKIFNKLLKERGEEEYLSLVISVMYFMSKNQPISVMAIENHGIERIAQIMMQRHDKQALIFKCFALMQLLHTSNYKRKILNHFISNDPKMQYTKTFNYILRRAQNKTEMGARAVFFYDYLLGKGTIDSLAILMETNEWMVEDLISTRNEYIGKVDSLVYKIEMILNGVCERSKKLNKIYQRFKIEGDISSGDEEN